MSTRLAVVPRRLRVSALGEGTALSLVLCAAVGIPLAIALGTGAISAPQGDDWAYFRSESVLMHGGGFHLTGWGEATLIGHLLWGAPFAALFGTSIASANVAGAAAAVLGLYAAYRLFSWFLPARLALFGVAALAAVPVLAIVTVSFMTDVTALAFQLVCLALGLAAMEGHRPRRRALLAASLATGLIAFAVREVALAAPVAVLFGHWIATRRRGHGGRTIAAIAAVFVIVCVVFYAWRLSLPGGHVVTGSPTLRRTGAQFVGLYFSLAFLVLPALALTGRRCVQLLRDPFPRAVAAIALAAGLGRLLLGGPGNGDPLLVGDYLVRDTGTGYSQLGPAPAFLPVSVWVVVEIAALAGGVLLAALLADRARFAWRALRRHGTRAFDPRVWTLIVFALLAAGLISARNVDGVNVVDRYLLPVIPPLLVLLLATGRAESRAPGVRRRGLAVLAAMAVLAVIYTSYTDAWQSARWHAGEQLVRSGIPANQVDAGFEWVGLHQTAIVHRDAVPKVHRWTQPAAPYMTLFPDAGNCGIVSSTPRSDPALTLVGTRTWRPGPLRADRTYYLYRNSAGCAR